MKKPLRLFPEIVEARFDQRPNRFVLEVQLDGKKVKAYLPNPGRLRELLLPGVKLSLVKNKGGKLPYTAVAVDREGSPIMLHTHKTNDVARYLLESGVVPGFEKAKVVAAEHTVGSSRFDFLLEVNKKPVLLEVKSCTLFGERVAMFPDAITARGARHVRELAHLAKKGQQTAVLFVVHWPFAQVFSPDYHTDLEFAKALLAARNHVSINALSIKWSKELTLLPEVSPCEIPWDRIKRQARDRGSYLIVLELRKTQKIETGALGQLEYKKGFYVYVGSAMANLTKRIERHRRVRKKLHWHIDYLRNETEFVDALPIRSSRRLECKIARAVEQQSEGSVKKFGSSDCRCPSHLFWFSSDPRKTKEFQDLLSHFRMDHLVRS